MRRKQRRTFACCLAAAGAAFASIGGQQTLANQGKPHKPHAGMLRNPDVGPDQIVFRYANDIWRVDKKGGTAVRVAGPSGVETFPRFSPDGKSIAFVGNYEGNTDIYVIPTEGGQAIRMTYHPAGEALSDWGQNGQLVYHAGGVSGVPRAPRVMTVGLESGPPKPLPVPYGANGAISADGEWLAYTPHARDNRTWKRYRGGMASDIWLFNLKNNESLQMTDWEGTDSIPMWHGKTVYYLSDQGEEHRLNIWAYDVEAKSRRQVTKFADYDVKWPSIGHGGGAGEIVFQLGADLRLLDLASGESRVVEVMIPGDRETIRPQTVNANSKIMSSDISSTGKRAVFSARGDIWTVPAKKGSTRNLTMTPGVAERDAYWSPDGRWISYFGDATGEYELYVMQSDGKGETRKLTDDGSTFRHHPVWSPDSKHIAFSDKTGKMFHHDIEAGTTKLIDTDPWASPMVPHWAPDSRWLCYAKGADNRNSSIWIYKVESGERHQVTSDMFNDTAPTFDREGKYLFFASSRDFSSFLSADLDTTFVYADTEVLLVCPLRDEVGSPWAPESDEESWEDDEEDGDDEGDADDEDDDKADDKDGDEADDDGDDEADDDGDEKKEDIEPIEIELDTLERRCMKIPVERGTFYGLSVNDQGHLLYVRQPRRGSMDKPAIKIYDLEDDDKKEKTVLADTGGYSISADGKKLLCNKGGSFYIIDAAADQKLDDAKLSLAGMKADVNPREEWAQVFYESWRILRDYFYDPTMHGVDWPAMRKAYEPLLNDCVSRDDVRFVIGEMISELNVGHAYVRGGYDSEPTKRRNVGMLGADYELNNGAFQIVNIVEGAAWDYDARGPLSQPNVDVNEGDYLLEVNGKSLDVSKSPYAAFLGLAGETVTITVSTKPTKDDDAREVVVKPLSNEGRLRFREWVEKNRAYVEQFSDGQVGYVYVPNTSTQGRTELFRQFMGQRHKKAMIIDERWNGGGFIPNRIIELLNRPVLNYWALRDGKDWTWPPDAHQGPKCMLINGMAGSGGDCFPYYFRQAGLGPLIGMRTWGGLVGIQGYPRLIDGGGVTAPSFAFYENDGTWGVEGHGVDPDVEIIDDPAKMVDGGDPQLEAAIKLMMTEVRRQPFIPAKRPAYPDRRGMGIPESDW